MPLNVRQSTWESHSDLHGLLEKLDLYRNTLHNAYVPSKQMQDTFRDGERLIDFVLVFDMKQQSKLPLVTTLIENLEEEGLQFESEHSEKYVNYLFIKVHCPTDVLLRASLVYGIKLTFQDTENYHMKFGYVPRFMHTEFTKPLNRQSRAVIRRKPKTITSAERIMIVSVILSNTRYGDRPHEFGVSTLLSGKALKACFPLHDGWMDRNSSSDRQLLYRYWSRPRNLLKVQPLDLIYNYYGAEIAFYFAFLGHMTKMLAVASVVGILSVVFGFATVMTSVNRISTEVCNSELIMCPTCYRGQCGKYRTLKGVCMESHANHIVNNWFSHIFGLFMTFWAICFLVLWKRKASQLRLYWNLTTVETYPTFRAEYVSKATLRQISTVTGNVIMQVARMIRIGKLIVSYTISILLAFMSIGVVILMTFLKISLKLMLRWQLSHWHYFLERKYISATMTNCIIVVFIIVLGKAFDKTALALVRYENHRTQHQYESSLIYKEFCFGFINSVGYLYYTSLFKSRFFWYPQLETEHIIDVLNLDLCEAYGCMVEAATQLAMILLGKSILKALFKYFKPVILQDSFKDFLLKRKHTELSHWEFAFSQKGTSVEVLIQDFKDMIIQYSIIVMFSTVFPLAPLIALLANIVWLRVDAIKMTMLLRRPVPRLTNGLGAWDNVIASVTYIGIVTNAFILAFTTLCVPRFVRLLTGNLHQSFINHSVSAFATKDFTGIGDNNNKTLRSVEVCHYSGQRYSPSHPLKYTVKVTQWHETTFRMFTVVVIECVMLTFSISLLLATPPISRSMKHKFRQDRRKSEYT